MLVWLVKRGQASWLVEVRCLLLLWSPTISEAYHLKMICKQVIVVSECKNLLKDVCNVMIAVYFQVTDEFFIFCTR